jgi:hypothetical protein
VYLFKKVTMMVGDIERLCKKEDELDFCCCQATDVDGWDEILKKMVARG